MNDTTLPIPSSNKKANPRRRPDRGVHGGVRRGFGLHDWMGLLRRAPDLAQRRGAPVRRDISLVEVAAHDRPHDGWMVLRGRVYNVAPYLQYHPGGSAIMEDCLGKDATALFERYHSWVNLDGLVGPLLLGRVEAERLGGVGEIEERNVDDDSSDGSIVLPAAAAAFSGASCAKTTTTNSNDSGFALPRPRPCKGDPVASLLPSDDKEDGYEEDDALQSIVPTR